MDTPEADVNRPRQLHDMTGATQSGWLRLHAIVTRPDPPHVIVAGPAGIGKSCALRLSLGSAVTMWLRCSQDPTLRDSRDRIKAAARRRVESGQLAWIVLEHADLLHTDAQAFLRRIIETSVGGTRFALEVRDLAAIAEPLLSRTILFNAPSLLTHEVRAEICHRAPSVPVDVAERIAAQSNGNMRWGILQGLAWRSSSEHEAGFLAAELGPAPATISDWNDVLKAMEALQRTGTNPRVWLQDTSVVWDRPGGSCPWALTALALASRLA